MENQKPERYSDINLEDLLSKDRLTGRAARLYKGAGVIVVTNIRTDKQYVGTCLKDTSERVKTILHRGNMPKAMVADREHFRSSPDHETWKIEVIPMEQGDVDDKQFQENLSLIKHDVIMELKTLHPLGYNRTTDKVFCHDAKIQTSESIRKMIDERKEQV